jgi:hypothetical protein
MACLDQEWVLQDALHRDVEEIFEPKALAALPLGFFKRLQRSKAPAVGIHPLDQVGTQVEGWPVGVTLAEAPRPSNSFSRLMASGMLQQNSP